MINRTDTAQDSTTFTIHPGTLPGHVHYTTANLEKQVAFYREVLGFKLHWQEGESAGLGAGGKDLLRLSEKRDARRVQGTTGLYHTAFLVPTRWQLAQLLKRIAETHTPIQGSSNHGTHHAIYLPDPEGNGIELAWDLPEAVWPKTFEEMLRNNRGLHPNEVFSALDDQPGPWEGLDPQTRVGHVHLHVSQLGPVRSFYHDLLGFEIPFDMQGVAHPIADTAIFFAAGGYHHHIGTNVWQGVGAPPPPDDALGLRYFSMVLPDEDSLRRVLSRTDAAGTTVREAEEGFLLADPAGNGLLLTLA
jgi:catechol 2,3-dioxygenase